jgi:hypothetical protein
MELNEMGITEFRFKDLPEDLKFQRCIQKARDLGLLKSVGFVKGSRVWKTVRSKIPEKTMGMQNKKEYKKEGILNKKEGVKNKNDGMQSRKEGIEMSLEPVDIWIEELKKRGIRTFEHKNLPEDLKDRVMIIKAKYANVIKKSRIATSGSKGSTKHTVWEII